MMKKIGSIFRLFGIDLSCARRALRELPGFLRSRSAFAKMYEASGREFPIARLYPCLGEATEPAGVGAGQYFHQDLIVAQEVFGRNPKRHGDVGSRVDGLIAHIASFREIDAFDIRPISSEARNIRFAQLDITKPVPAALVGAYDSFSCLHALEHIGLGRYGDDLDYYGYKKGMQALAALLAPEGVLYLSVPFGPQRIEFNAHRVFSLEHLLEVIDSDFTIERFDYVDDADHVHRDAAWMSPPAPNFGCNNGLALLTLRRRAAVT